jgi:uncharacterized membrane protein
MAEFAHHPEERRHFVRRLEAFGDIVYGFSLSQTGFALVVPEHPGDLFEHPASVIGGALTFIAICIWWLGYHRMFAHAFVAERIDVVLNFAVLGTVAFLPFALRVWLRFGNDPHGGLLYGGNFALSMTLMTILLTRGYLRFGSGWSDARRLQMWRAMIRHTILAVVFAATLVAWHRFGLQGAWLLTALWLLPLLRLVRRAPVPNMPRPVGGTLDARAGS